MIKYSVPSIMHFQELEASPNTALGQYDENGDAGGLELSSGSQSTSGLSGNFDVFQMNLFPGLAINPQPNDNDLVHVSLTWSLKPESVWNSEVEANFQPQLPSGSEFKIGSIGSATELKFTLEADYQFGDLKNLTYIFGDVAETGSGSPSNYTATISYKMTDALGVSLALDCNDAEVEVIEDDGSPPASGIFFTCQVVF